MERHRKANSFRDRDTPGDPRLLAAIERRTPGVAGGGINHFFGSTVITPPKKRKRGGSTVATACPFGNIETWTEGTGSSATTKTGIRGGTVYCGDKNFAVDRKSMDLGTASVSLVYLEIACEANMDDDNELILGGVKTSSETNPATFWKTASWAAGPPATQYPDNTSPTITNVGIGKIIIPIGKLTIADGAATLEKVDCGNVVVNQCGGTLTHTRG